MADELDLQRTQRWDLRRFVLVLSTRAGGARLATNAAVGYTLARACHWVEDGQRTNMRAGVGQLLVLALRCQRTRGRGARACKLGPRNSMNGNEIIEQGAHLLNRTHTALIQPPRIQAPPAETMPKPRVPSDCSYSAPCPTFKSDLGACPW